MLDLLNRKFGRLTVTRFVGKRNRSPIWEVRCECGVIKKVASGNLLGKSTISCGCWASERITKVNTTHGGAYTSEYKVWDTMFQRCTNKNDHSYKRYGGRGIKICTRWNRFENFLKDMGLRPSTKHSIERIDNDGSYTPKNCKWATLLEQSRNRSNNLLVTYKDRKLPLSEWAEIYNIKYRTLWVRFKKLKWPIERALTEPLHLEKVRTFNKVID